MAGTISFGGIGSGLDTEGIVTGLVSASSGQLNQLKSRIKATESSVTNLSNLGTLLSKLKSAADALDTSSEVGSYKASSSSTAIVASASAAATPGSYSITVNDLATETRAYSGTFASETADLGLNGTFRI